MFKAFLNQDTSSQDQITFSKCDELLKWVHDVSIDSPVLIGTFSWHINKLEATYQLL